MLSRPQAKERTIKMKILAIVASKHLGNTRKIAEAMAEVAPITIADMNEAANYSFADYDIVGFGGGIYAGSHDRKLIKFAEGFNDKPVYTFVFSTSGTGKETYNNALIKALEGTNKKVLGSFTCKGLDKFFILKLFGGTNKGKPDEQDFKNAKIFILDVMKKYHEDN